MAYNLQHNFYFLQMIILGIPEKMIRLENICMSLKKVKYYNVTCKRHFFFMSLYLPLDIHYKYVPFQQIFFYFTVDFLFQVEMDTRQMKWKLLEYSFNIRLFLYYRS